MEHRFSCIAGGVYMYMPVIMTQWKLTAQYITAFIRTYWQLYEPVIALFEETVFTWIAEEGSSKCISNPLYRLSV